MRRTAVLFAFVALFTGSAFAQPKMIPRPEDHLEPDGSVLGGSDFMADYASKLRDVLHAAYEPDVTVRMIAQPSFVPEYAVGLRGGKTIGKGDFKTFIPGAPYRIFGLSPAASVWTYPTIAMLKSGQIRAIGKNAGQQQKEEIEKAQASVPANPRDLKVSQCETGISDALGGRIVEVWHKMLMRTRYSQKNMNGADGATYNFSMYVRGHGPISGNVWSPDRNSSTGTLVALANAMYDVCNKEKGASANQVEKLTAELEQRLK